MVKNSFFSEISHEQEKKEEIKGSVEFQVVNFTNQIRKLTSHLELHKKDYLSQRGLKKILGKRQRLLAYLSKKKSDKFAVKIVSLTSSVQIKYKQLILFTLYPKIGIILT